MNDTLRTIHSLHTTHGNFQPDRRLEPEILETILAATVRAASASAMQTYSIIVMEDAQRQREVCGYAASATLLFCVDYTRLVDSAARLGHSFEVGGIVGFVTGAVNTLLAAQTTVIAARALGVDSLVTNGIHRVDLQETYRRLNLPVAHCFPLIAICLGYAIAAPEAAKGRLCGPGVIHRGAYQRATPEQLDAIIAAHDKQGIGVTADWRAGGLQHYLDWFFTKWARPVAPAKIAEFDALLTRAGFLTAPGASA
jgi:nitroreductase